MEIVAQTEAGRKLSGHDVEQILQALVTGALGWDIGQVATVVPPTGTLTPWPTDGQLCVSARLTEGLSGDYGCSAANPSALS